MAIDKEQLAKQLRKTAAYYREQAREIENDEIVKCAQVLTAVRGLEHFKRILKGVER